jgi:Carboxypeptidase regulatory-like domain/TonB dependent receptor-like, beta-barrel
MYRARRQPCGVRRREVRIAMIRFSVVRLVCLIWAIAMPAAAFAQAQAANGNIEGTVRDATGGALPGVMVTLVNTDLGSSRTVLTNDQGVFRAPLLPLGVYTLTAELKGFDRYEESRLTLSAGQTIVANIQLEVGKIGGESVEVSSVVSPAQAGRIDLGRTIGEGEIHNLPLVSRNPYNFAFLQANVTGYENNEFGVPRINANGSQMHTNYQLDGNTNTEKDRAGLRMLPVSEVLVREVKVITNGFAPEFGQTTGMVYNAITPSGSNALRGSGSFRFRRNAMSERPFFLAPTARKPDTEVNDATATLGGPIVRDKLHFFGAYEFVDRSLITGGQVITVTPANAERLGITLPESGVIPANQSVNFGFGKIDHEINTANRLSARYFLFKNFSESNIGGGLTTPDRATDFTDRMDSASAQLTSILGTSMFNELRVQYARRHQFRTPSPSAVDGPAITVTGIAQFGGPRLGDSNSVGFDFEQGIWQVVDNVSWIRGRHSFKAGIDAQWVGDDRVKGERFEYVFPTIDAYLAASAGTAPLGYTTFRQDFGDLTASYSSGFYGFFVQDDWQVTPNLKVLYGLRYDLFDVPSARSFAANPYSQDFTIDKSNWGPRAGLSWSLDRSGRSVLRASTGLMYEPPLLDFYDNAILNNGDPRSYTVQLAGTSAGAPAFPASLANAPAGFVLPRQSINAVDPAFRTQSAWLTNVQFERAIRTDMSVAVGYVNSTGRNLPVLMDVNLIPTGAVLPDGRPVFSTAVNAATRFDTAFDHVNMFKSIGEAKYNAFTATFTKRMKQGWQAQATYTLARGEDNAPLTGTYVVGSGDDRVSDPTDLAREWGVTPFNQAHTFAVSTVVAPVVAADGFLGALANNNQLGLILQANSGLPFNIRSRTDLNQDGVTNDRPDGLERNAGRLGRVVYLDLRYSRFVPFSDAQRLELFFEAKNLFNTQNVSAVTRDVTTDATGILAAPLPSPFPPQSAYDQRQMQLGVKFTF